MKFLSLTNTYGQQVLVPAGAILCVIESQGGTLIHLAHISSSISVTVKESIAAIESQLKDAP